MPKLGEIPSNVFITCVCACACVCLCVCVRARVRVRVLCALHEFRGTEKAERRHQILWNWCFRQL